MAEEDLNRLRAAGEQAIVDEIESASARAGDKAEKDDLGWTDRDWLSYFRTERASDKVAPDTMADVVIDRGHASISLDGLPCLDDLGPVGVRFACRRDHATLADMQQHLHGVFGACIATTRARMLLCARVVIELQLDSVQHRDDD